MNEVLYTCILLVSVLMSAASQAMLKASSDRSYSTHISEYLNPLVIGAYSLLFFSTVLVVVSLKVLPLSLLPLFEALGYVFVAVIGVVFFKEHIRGRKLVGLALIVAGMLVATC